ncbi:MAG: S9 family peptidase [Acidimicrobiia bacterium]
MTSATPPVSKTVDGPDPWAWLRNREDPDTIAYLEAENTYADTWFDAPDIAALRGTLFDEIKSRTLETDLSVPVKKGPWWYYSRTVEGLDYGIHCRRSGRDAGDEIVLLDENELAEGNDYHALGVFNISFDHRRIAYSTDHDGSEIYTMRIRELVEDGEGTTTAVDLPDLIDQTYYGCAWSADGNHVFYTVPDDAMRPYQVWRHEIGTAQSDILVYEENDPSFNVSVGNTRSQAYILIEIASLTTSETWFIPTASPTDPPRCIERRHADVEYDVDHRGDEFVIVTNLDAPDFRVVTAPISWPSRTNWQEIITHVPGRRITSVQAFADHLVMSAWEDATPTITVLRDGIDPYRLRFDDPVHSAGPAGNAEFETSLLRFHYQSLTTPPSIFEEDLTTGARELLKQQPVLGDFDATRYVGSREWATAPDGTKVPISVVRHRDTALDGTAPLVLYGYGSYEASMAPWFSIARLSLLDRGVVFAVGHIRGGGELGRNWYLNGKMLNKRNTFTDFIACAEHLVAARIGAPDRVAIRGGSAGGLLVGASMAMAPEHFAAVVAEVPFVDVVNTMLDETLPLTVIEWEEWGNPNDPTYHDYIASYSPYENVPTTARPAMYVTAGLNDPRVSYHEPAKWVAKLRALSPDDNVLLFRTELGAGHGGPSGRYDEWRDEARVLSFILRSLRVV